MRVYKADLGLWEHQRSRRKTYRKIWCQGTETPEKTESYPGRNCKAKSMEKGKGCSQADQVEFRNRRLLVHADIQERLTATLETDAERYVKIHSKAPGQAAKRLGDRAKLSKMRKKQDHWIRIPALHTDQNREEKGLTCKE